jgi:hypothetical protein
MNSDKLTIICAFGSATAGAAVGAFSAYKLGVRNEESKEKLRNHAGLLKAQYSLMSQWNIIRGLQKDLLDPIRSDPYRYLNISKFYSSGSPIRVPFEDISFISLSENPNLLQDIHIAEQNYDTVTSSLERLVESIDQFQSNPDVIMKRFNFETGAAQVDAEPRHIFWVKKWTDTLYDVTDKAVPLLEKEIESITQFSKENFKGMKALRMASKDWENQGPESPLAKRKDLADNYSIRSWIKTLWKDYKN